MFVDRALLERVLGIVKLLLQFAILLDQELYHGEMAKGMLSTVNTVVHVCGVRLAVWMPDSFVKNDVDGLSKDGDKTLKRLDLR